MKQKIPSIRLICLVILVTLSCALNAQTKSARFKIDTSKVQIKPTDTEKILKAELKLQEKIEVRKKSDKKIKIYNFNLKHEKYHLYYNGIKIEYSDIRVHYENDKVVMINGDYVPEINISIKPEITKEYAINKALEYIGADKYIWENQEENIWLQNKFGEKEATFYPQPELVICKNYLSQSDTSYHIAYKMDIYAISPLSRDYIYVNAITGEVINIEPRIKTVNANAATRYSGTRTISTELNGSTYRLRDYDNSRGDGIETYNLNNSTSYSSATDFTDADNNWTSGEYDNTAKDNGALDAHWSAIMTYDYFQNIHGRDSYDDAGTAIESYVHYGTNYENAFWNGSVMTYGDGNTNFDILTSIDVAAHEIGHAVCTHTAGLAYRNESGAINEGLSDIWGACVEEYATNDKETWLIGEDIDLRVGHDGLRSMSNPNAEGDPDTYLGDFWYTGTGDHGGVHTNSGVMNHWFYLLTEGGTGTNDNDDNYNVTGIGITSAAEITYRAESVYMTSNTTYADARTHTIQSAEDLFGTNSQEVSSVISAWYAVGVGVCTNEILENTTIITSTTVRGCNIEVENVSVTNGSKLILDSENETTINGPFEVELGSELEIK